MSDDEAVRELYAGSYRRLVRQLYPLTGDLGEAQDVVQEAFVKLLTARRTSALENPEAWLRTVAINLARSRWRRGKVLRRLLRQVESEPAEVPGVTPDHVALMAALRHLPERQRTAIALHYLADLPIAEIAEALRVSVGAVKSRLSRGRTALAALLDDSLDGSADGSVETPDRAPERRTHHA